MKVFNTGLNTFYRKYLFTNPNENQALIAATFETEYNKTLSELIEQLLFFDKISIKIYGENLALTVLINDLGLKQTLELVDDGVIEFILWTPMLATLVEDDPNLMGKVNPIVSGNVNSAIHSQPDLSIKAGLQALRKQPDRGTRRDIERKVIKAYRIPKADFVHNAAAIVSSAYSSNKLTGVGMPKTKEIAWLDKEERFKLLGLGDDILETTILLTYIV
ncbi:hypothetical protein [Mucilaginibacter sp. L196]|uniref:hypothetical protein n=1 Tax=Mucilaginibacter sp. L196 TaxID=1641870 RepID=UPI00131AF89E|nr:hypothetical protein [Mucilaginibacter sp. L196]